MVNLFLKRQQLYCSPDEITGKKLKYKDVLFFAGRAASEYGCLSGMDSLYSQTSVWRPFSSCHKNPDELMYALECNALVYALLILKCLSPADLIDCRKNPVKAQDILIDNDTQDMIDKVRLLPQTDFINNVFEDTIPKPNYQCASTLFPIIAALIIDEYEKGCGCIGSSLHSLSKLIRTLSNEISTYNRHSVHPNKYDAKVINNRKQAKSRARHDYDELIKRLQEIVRSICLNSDRPDAAALCLATEMIFHFRALHESDEKVLSSNIHSYFAKNELPLIFGFDAQSLSSTSAYEQTIAFRELTEVTVQFFYEQSNNNPIVAVKLIKNCLNNNRFCSLLTSTFAYDIAKEPPVSISHAQLAALFFDSKNHPRKMLPEELLSINQISLNAKQGNAEKVRGADNQMHIKITPVPFKSDFTFSIAFNSASSAEYVLNHEEETTATIAAAIRQEAERVLLEDGQFPF